MSKGEILYVKGMDMSDSDNDDEEGVWDDRKINEAYDKAIQIAGAEVAKRLAMSTNTSSKEVVDSKSKRTPKAGKSSGSQKKSKPWKAGKPCRAVYEGDGIEYEAIILRIINNEECVIRFLGYDNSEIVPLNLLKPSLGEGEQARQMEDAMNAEFEEPQEETREKIDFSTERPNSSGTEKSYCSKKKHLSKKKHHSNKSTNVFNLPEILAMPPMPNLSMMKNLGPLDMPPPPPPPAFSPDRADGEEQAISSMLLSWYMSGYYTGLYQGMKRANKNRRH